VNPGEKRGIDGTASVYATHRREILTTDAAGPIPMAHRVLKGRVLEGNQGLEVPSQCGEVPLGEDSRRIPCVLMPSQKGRVDGHLAWPGPAQPDQGLRDW
jgi:hypothetical protein